MKIKNIFITLGVCAAMGFGAFTGIKASKGEIKEAEASTVGENSDWGIVGEGDAFGSWSPASRARLTFTDCDTSLHSWKNVTFSGGTKFKLMNTDNWGSDIGFNSLTFGDKKGDFTSDTGDNPNIIAPSGGGTYDVCVAYISSLGKNVIGIFASGTLSNYLAKSIYICEKPDNNGNWNPSKIYMFGGIKQYGDWQGSNMTSADSPTVNLAGEYGNVRKISYAEHADDTFIIHNGNGYQSTNTSLVAGSAYYFVGNWNGGDDNGKAVLQANANLGLAADFIVRVEAVRNAVTASGSIKQYSVCGIDAQKAADFYTEYSGMVSGVKSLVDDTTITTYKRNGETGNETVSYDVVMEQLRDIAVKAGKLSNSSSIVLPFENNANNTAIIIVVVSTISLLGLAGFFFIKRKKESK